MDKYFLVGRDLVGASVSLVRPESFDQTEWLGCLDLLGCEYAVEVLAREPDAALTLQLFSEGPIYCKSSAEVKAMAAHLERIGVPLEARLADAMLYRKDGARIAALHGFRERLNAAINNGIERGRVKTPAWDNPYPTHFIGLAKADGVP